MFIVIRLPVIRVPDEDGTSPLSKLSLSFVKMCRGEALDIAACERNTIKLQKLHEMDCEGLFLLKNKSKFQNTFMSSMEFDAEPKF